MAAGNYPGHRTVIIGMERRIIEIKTSNPVQQDRSSKERLPLIAGPTVWYAMAGLSILLALYLFLFASAGEERTRHEIAIFIGLWAPMFGILGLRAEMLELREDVTRRRR